MGADPITNLPHIQRMNSLRGDAVNLEGDKLNIQDKELTPDKIKRAVRNLYLLVNCNYVILLSRIYISKLVL